MEKAVFSRSASASLTCHYPLVRSSVENQLAPEEAGLEVENPEPMKQALMDVHSKDITPDIFIGLISTPTPKELYIVLAG